MKANRTRYTVHGLIRNAFLERMITKVRMLPMVPNISNPGATKTQSWVKASGTGGAASDTVLGSAEVLSMPDTRITSEADGPAVISSRQLGI